MKNDLRGRSGARQGREQTRLRHLHRLRLHQLPLDEGEHVHAAGNRRGDDELRPGRALHRRHGRGERREPEAAGIDSSRPSRFRSTPSSMPIAALSPSSRASPATPPSSSHFFALHENSIASILLACAAAARRRRTFAAFPRRRRRPSASAKPRRSRSPSPQRLRTYMEQMSAEPHIAGSPASKAVAEYIAGLLREWGLDVQIEEFEALLPYPKSRSLEMTAPDEVHGEAAGTEDRRGSRFRRQGPGSDLQRLLGQWRCHGQVVYVNYGVPEDYEQLKKLGIDVKGKIVLARYGKSWRGTKAKVAQENGAVGCLIYSDPAR